MKFLRFAIYIYIAFSFSYLYISYVIVTKVTNHNGVVSLELKRIYRLLIALPLRVFHVLFSSVQCAHLLFEFLFME